MEKKTAASKNDREATSKVNTVILALLFIAALLFGVIGLLQLIYHIPKYGNLYDLTMVMVSNGFMLFGILLCLLGISFLLRRNNRREKKT
ncbi:MAG: hypothetical protein GWO20_05725 [Candidatus Korarchaeota archaeon]|nr:hypothetical protein [Candidatus Korarchaeota archaeon]NIU82954.1 hypothetical protein [Candidatus Thorarchaeota archaeon]NIW13377.1 hypothetical protein [Candidatus Thorarchaeota archaeon]NIW51477.1 hypothetical protein [Candidatus Korarchaeota archaeon]